jgi:hypothetical protein
VNKGKRAGTTALALLPMIVWLLLLISAEIAKR